MVIQEDPNPIPDGLLFHYTSVQGLHGIITNRTIWATDMLYLNDAAEFLYTLQLARRQIDYLVKSASSEDGAILMALDEYLTRKMQSPDISVFVASFSSCCDALSQWRAYAPYGSGFSIGFDFSKLKGRLANQNFKLVKCIYDESVQEEKIKTALLEALESVRKLREKNKNRNDLNLAKECWSILYRTLIPLASKLKHPKFSEEQEWRLVSSSMPRSLHRAKIKGTESPWKFRAGKSMLIPYVEFSLADENEGLECIQEVYVGPTPYSDLSVESVVSLLRNYVVTSFAVKESAAPYRGNSIAG